VQLHSEKRLPEIKKTNHNKSQQITTETETHTSYFISKHNACQWLSSPLLAKLHYHPPSPPIDPMRKKEKVNKQHLYFGILYKSITNDVGKAREVA
jgi:hypothetical protein